jgi:predicted PurR-regulated permease PerM
MAEFPRAYPEPDLGVFVQKVIVVFLFGAIAFALKQLAELAILLFGAVLIAIGLRSAARQISRLTRLSEGPSLALAIFAIVAIFGSTIWVFGYVIGSQMDELAKQIPQGLRLAADRIQSHPYGRYLLDQARGVGVASATGWAATSVTSFVRSLIHAAGYIAVSCIVAVYLAAQPDQYRKLVLRMVPQSFVPRVEQLFDRSGDALRRWLVGQLAVMAAIGTLSGIGLWVLGIDAPLALGLVGGLLCFVPYLGAILAAVPATLVALTQGPMQAALVILMYVGVHFIEGNFITPLVQAEATSLPPVISLVSIIAFAALLGPSAVLVAVPMALFVLVALDVLYVETVLGSPPGSEGVGIAPRDDLKRSA